MTSALPTLLFNSEATYVSLKVQATLDHRQFFTELVEDKEGITESSMILTQRNHHHLQSTNS